jgi:hypothetical protein
MNKINQNKYAVVLQHEVSSLDIDNTEVTLDDQHVCVSYDDFEEIFYLDINNAKVDKESSHCFWENGMLTITIVLIDNWVVVPMIIQL